MHGPAPSIADFHARPKLGNDVARICEQLEGLQPDAILARLLHMAKLPEVLTLSQAIEDKFLGSSMVRRQAGLYHDSGRGGSER